MIIDLTLKLSNKRLGSEAETAVVKRGISGLYLNGNKESSEKLLDLTGRYEKLAEDFDKLAGKYRDVAVDKTSFITIDLGAGVTDKSGEAEGAALLGVGISKLKVWGFFQDDNSGILAGASFRF